MLTKLAKGSSMEGRLRNVENNIVDLKNDFTDLKTDVKLVTQTLSSIDNTLKELKETNEKLHSIEKKLIQEDNNVTTLFSHTKVLFRFKDSAEERLRQVERNDSVQGVKIGSGEKVFWIGLSSVIGLLVAIFKNGGI